MEWSITPDQGAMKAREVKRSGLAMRGTETVHYTVIWLATVQYLLYLARESRYWVKRNIGSPLPNKSDIRQAADQTTVFLFPPRMLIFPIITGYYFKS